MHRDKHKWIELSTKAQAARHTDAGRGAVGQEQFLRIARVPISALDVVRNLLRTQRTNSATVSPCLAIYHSMLRRRAPSRCASLSVNLCFVAAVRLAVPRYLSFCATL